MKIKTSLVFLLLSAFLFLFLYLYTETELINSGGYFNYHISNITEYISIWGFVLFVLSLLASKLDVGKYKFWLLISVVVSVVSILIAIAIGDGNGTIIGINGEFANWFLIGLYSFISIIYFIIQLFKNRKTSV